MDYLPPPSGTSHALEGAPKSLNALDTLTSGRPT